MAIDMSFIPDGISGDWRVETFVVPKNDLSQSLSMMRSGRGVPSGEYKRLMRGDVIVMSNTPDELSDCRHFMIYAKGSVLINGLGLGCVVKVLLEKPDITKITVIEKSEDVINLVQPHFHDSRLNIIHADSFDYKPPKGEKFDFVWHDIWDYICADNLEEMGKLHRKYGRRCKWQDSWAKDLCKRLERQDRRYSKYF